MVRDTVYSLHAILLCMDVYDSLSICVSICVCVCILIIIMYTRAL